MILALKKYAPLIAKLALIVSIFLAGWFGNGWRYEAKIKTMENKALSALNAANEAHREKERELNDKVKTAQENSAKREIQIRTDANSVRNINNSLRDELTSIRRELSTDTREALIKRADTAAKLLGDCSGEYTKVAESADRHASDVRTLSEAWAK